MSKFHLVFNITNNISRIFIYTQNPHDNSNMIVNHISFSTKDLIANSVIVNYDLFKNTLQDHYQKLCQLSGGR